MKNVLTLTLLLGVSLLTFAQNSTSKVEKKQFKINMLAPGLEYEWGLSEKSTLAIGFETSFAYRNNSGNSSFAVFPVFNGGYRHYYNFERRLQKEKRTQFNSANYVGFSTYATFLDLKIGDYEFNNEYVISAGPVWGFQRTYSSKFNLLLELGPGIMVTNTKVEATVVANFTLGWVIGK